MSISEQLTFYGTGSLGRSVENVYARNGGMVLSFSSLATGVRADFKAFITDFMDNFNSSWASDQPYGKADPIRHFSGTSRTMQVSWQCVASTAEEAADNMRKISALAQMQYPIYENRGHISSGSPGAEEGLALGEAMRSDSTDAHRWCISGPPLIVVRFANLIKSAIDGQNARNYGQIPYGSYPDPEVISKRLYGEEIISGVIGAFDSFHISPRIDAGFFEIDFGVLYPKIYDLTCMFTVLHQATPNILADEITGEFKNAFGDIYGVGFANRTGYGDPDTDDGELD